MDKDKAIRSAKLTAAGMLDKARARTAVNRAGGQIAPSKYLPNVPRQVHADGGKVDFVKDNPGGDWLESKQSHAFEYPRMKGIAGAITGWMGGKSDLFLPTHVLKSIEPLNNEKRVAGEPRFDDLMSSVSKEGFDPHQKGNKVVVAVNHRGKPFILEGNTRVAVAHAMGVPSVKAEVRYWNGAEEADGPMHPDKVSAMASSDPDITKAGGGTVDNDDEDGITAYHGSPHDFDQFDISKLGTGEGNQSYGHGLYFAGNEAVAKGYRNSLSDTLIHPEGTPDLEKRAGQMALVFSDNTPEGAVKWLSKFKNGATHTSPNMTPELVEAVSKKFSSGDFRPGGHMYKVKLNVKPEELLDWDKPLSEQHPNIQRIAREADINKAIGPTRGVLQAWREGRDVGVEATGRDLHQALSNYGENGKQASDYLQSQGLKGIRYLDAGSRNDTDGDPTHNYVMFHHDPVQVTDKYEYGGMVSKQEGGEVGDNVVNLGFRRTMNAAMSDAPPQHVQDTLTKMSDRHEASRQAYMAAKADGVFDALPFGDKYRYLPTPNSTPMEVVGHRMLHVSGWGSKEPPKLVYQDHYPVVDMEPVGQPAYTRPYPVELLLGNPDKYQHISGKPRLVKRKGGSVDNALALTRRFTKDGKGATVALKSKGK